jgi:hypothetical protein
MPKYSIRQSTQSGAIANSVGDNQEITITQVGTGRNHQAQPTPPIPAAKPGSDEDIVSPTGTNARVFINGKRVQ